jgi:hypothetical protein
VLFVLGGVLRFCGEVVYMLLVGMSIAWLLRLVPQIKRKGCLSSFKGDVCSILCNIFI